MFCLQCSKLILHKNFCDSCWEILRVRKFQSVREVDSFPVFTSWIWPVNHPLRALWLQRLKHQEDKRLWMDIAQLLYESNSVQTLPWSKDSLWIPLPSSGLKNHALGFAKALVSVYGGTLWDGLEMATQEEQKNKNRNDRQNRKIRTLGKAPCTSFKTVCLVDDIITTGSTFRGAFAALEYPENGLGIALMDRPLLN